ESMAYVVNAGTNSVTRVDFTTGDTATVAVGVYPRGAALARGRLFVINANVEPCATGLCSLGQGWVTVIAPISNQHASGRDSIPLPPAGDACSITVGGDSFLYILSAGDSATETLGRLTIVDPVSRAEVGSFGGFGLLPGAVASDGADRIFVTSVDDDLMEFNARNRRVVPGGRSSILRTVHAAAATG